MRHGTIRRVRSLSILILDLLLITSTLSIAYFWRIGVWPNPFDVDLWLITATFIAVLFITGTYFRERSSALPNLPIRTFFICLLGGLLCILWLYLLGPRSFNQYFGRGILPLGTVVIGTLTTLGRLLINRMYHNQESDHKILYLGYSESARNFLQELRNHAEVRAITIMSNSKPLKLPKRVNHLEVDQFAQSLDQSWNSIIIDPDFHPDQAQQSLLVKHRLRGANIGTLADYYEKSWFQVPVYDIGNDWFLQSTGFSALSDPAAQRIKRLFDISLAFTVLVLSVPLLIISALAIKLDSSGPVFFSQQRVGFRGNLFTIYKLRTMEVSKDSSAKWAQPDDPRVTRVGGFLRQSRIDELPQAWNVLKADMSFVGPRPEQAEFTVWLSDEIPFYDLRHQVKPGITGWAQVIFPYGASKEDAIKKLQYELYYIKHQSLFLDLNILVRTLITVFKRSGR